MQCKNGFLISGIILVSLCSFMAETDSYKEFKYLPGKFYPFSFSIFGPELIFIVKDGGVKIANTDVWYLEPKEHRKIIALEPDIDSECMYYLKIENDKSDKIRTVLAQLKKDDNNLQHETEIHSFEGDSFFKLFVLGNNRMYLLEKGQTNRIHYLEKGQLQTLYETKEVIDSFCPINSSSFLLVKNSQIAIYEVQKRSMSIVYTTPDNTAIDGLAVNTKGKIYYSTNEGIWKISGEVGKKVFYEKIFPKLHGEIKFLNPYLFIHIPQAATVARIKVENL